jgi:hypothetical protein
MTRIFRKYEFGSQSAATTKLNALGVDEEGNPTHSHSIVRLGHIVLTDGEYDEEGNETTAPVLSENYHVDVLWQGEPVAEWDSAMVWCPPVGIHVFGSSSAIAEWTEKCKELHPEYFPEPSEEI